MLVVSAALNETASVGVSEDLVNDYGVPCVFSGLSGIFHPAGGATAVVLCPPWGFEDLAMRKGWRLMAEAISKVGYPCLRFDYPGTGDSSGRATDPSSVTAWVEAVQAAADFLRRTTGVRRFVFIGQTLGATLAVEAARTRPDVVGLHLIAPVVKGRAHVRELAATSKLVADRLGIALEVGGEEALSVMGFALSAPMAESLKTLDLTRIDTLGVEHVVVYDQQGRKAGAEAAEHFRRLGANVSIETVEPYHLMVSDATASQPLPVTAERLVAILQSLHPLGSAQPQPAPISLPSVLVGRTFREEPIRFGADGLLFGMLCAPLLAKEDKPAVILLNRGLNPHIGWRRVSVDHARGLAAAGITSLRIDVAGLGESRDAPGRPVDLIYSELLVPDIRAAVDALAARGHARIMLAGVCSGGYMALAAAQADPRVSDVIAVNTQRFLWNPKESFEDVIRFGLRSMNDYVGDIKGGGAFKKLIRSRKRIVPAMVYLAKRHVRNGMARVPLRLRSLLMRSSMAARVERFFATFATRGTRVSLCYSDGDPGLMELRNYFGPNGRDMPHANVSVSIIPDADHNLTTTHASNWMLGHMIAVANEAPVRAGQRATPRQTREPRRAVCPT